MNYKLLALSFPILAFQFSILKSQSKEFVKKNFKDNKKGLHKALDSIKKGDVYYFQGPHSYSDALPYYMSAEHFNPDNDALNYKIGKCMIYSSLKNQASPYLEKSIKLNPLLISNAHYYLARAYHLTMDWDKAKQEYNIYLQTLTPEKTDEIADVRKKIEECDNGKLLCKSPVNVLIDNLGSSMNTKYPQYRPLISADETEMFYTSRMPAAPGIKVDPKDGEGYENIFVTHNKNGLWDSAVSLGAPVDTKSHTASAGLSADGQTLYIYRTFNNGDLYQTQLTNNVWTKPVRMNDKINSNWKETSITATADGKVFYFVSNRPGGYGMGDIYKVTSDDKGKWSEPKNLGPSINTQYDEQGVFLSADGTTFYFSSTGHNTMGGYDIFKSVNDSGQWSPPENLGYPINTPGDDVFFVMPANKKHAYYCSNQTSVDNIEIYRITFLGAEKPLAISNAPVALSGITSNIADIMMSSPVSVEGQTPPAIVK